MKRITDFKEYKGLINQHERALLSNRYITNQHIEPLLKNLDESFLVSVVGQSVLNRPIYNIKVGFGETKILIWSQMHGNESTTTKAIFDFLLFLKSKSNLAQTILQSCTLNIIPILNPDGAEAYNRLNANDIDLNRDAQALSQPESQLLRQQFEHFEPDYCFNLHGQRTIFGVGNTKKSAVLSFLSPATDLKRTVSPTRKITMDVISQIVKGLSDLEGHIGRYDDSFNINCVGDTFQSMGVPTILFEAGHYPNDYYREITRKYVFGALIIALNYIATCHPITGEDYKSYFLIKENQKTFYDVILRNAIVEGKLVDVAIQYQEKLIEGEIKFLPRVEKISNLASYYGHKEIDLHHNEIFDSDSSVLKEGVENVFVIANNEKIELIP